jgi:hypothetical protein
LTAKAAFWQSDRHSLLDRRVGMSRGRRRLHLDRACRNRVTRERCQRTLGTVILAERVGPSARLSRSS